MKAFLESNPGLHSRFNKFLHFDDYSPQELFQIFTKYCADDGYAFERACGGRIIALINLTHKKRAANFGNAMPCEICLNKRSPTTQTASRALQTHHKAI